MKVKDRHGHVDVPGMGMRRTNPGRVELYQQARLVVRQSRWELAQLWGGLGIGLLLVNLPYWPAYVRGLTSGLLVMTGIALTLWLVWYASGLGPRLEGTWAEQWTATELKNAPNVLETVANLRFERFDIDNIAVTRDAIYLIEVKRHRHFYPGVLEDDLDRFARNFRTARHFLSRALNDPLAPAPELITGVSVVWGRAGIDLLPTLVPCLTGDVVLVGGPHLRPWLDGLGTGYVGPDYARDLANELRRVAEQRERNTTPNSRLITWFARTK